MNCTGKTERRTLPAPLVQSAVDFLRGDELVLAPRLRWPKSVIEPIRSALPGAVEAGHRGAFKTTIPEPLRARPGRVLCLWGDAGWGSEVARGKYEAGRFSDALVEAVAGLVRDRWQPHPAPAWVTAVPSLHRTELVVDFARRLAATLQLPFQAVARRTRELRPQKEMQNSAQQVRNLIGAFALDDVPSGAVLLVDDVVDSGWTLTMLSVLLQLNGGGPVHPFALAQASPRGNQ
jgi:ATP-dependent DNA helicase RecQ